MSSAHVNGIEIPHAAILAEAQNHPAAAPEQAISAATQALVVRELLMQEARRQGLQPAPQIDSTSRLETNEDALIRQLLEAEISVPSADETACHRYYDNNRARFRSPNLYEAAHILFASDPADTSRYAQALADAERTIAVLREAPGAFDAIAQAQSDCTSARNGGRLGQVARGETVPEFETFLVALEDGQLCPVPIRSRYGVHVLRLDRKIVGRALPFEIVHSRIADYLHTASWRRAVAQYIKLLAGQARIEGVHLDVAASPLVQ